MTTIVGPRLDRDGNSTALYDTNTQETLVRLMPVTMDEDFIGPGHSSIPASGSPAVGYPWVKKTAQTGGVPTVAVVSNSPCGIVALTLAATSEAEEATLYQNDMLNWPFNLGAIFEARANLNVLPASSAEVVWGVMSSWASTPDTNAFYLRFQVSGSGALNIQRKDGVNTTSYSTGLTLVAGAFYNFKIDATDPTNVVFSVNGVNYSGVFGLPTIAFAATGANALLQPYASCYKATGTDVPSLQIDMIQVSANRQ